jgi:hypothetical protein
MASTRVGFSEILSNDRLLFFQEKLLRPAAVRASESDEVRLDLADLMPRDRHLGAAAETNGVLAGVERVEQKLLVAHGNLRGLRIRQTRQRMTKDEDRAEFTPCGPHGSCPLAAGFRRREINCDEPRAFHKK